MEVILNALEQGLLFSLVAMGVYITYKILDFPDLSVDKIFIGAFIAMLIGSAILLLTLFMPFASATDEYKEALEKFSDSMYIEELNMTNEEAINISLFEFIRIYSSETGKEISNDLSIVYVVVIAAFAVFALLTLLFSILRKSIPVIVFNILTFAVLRLIIWDFEDRGVISNSRYDWGIAQYIGYIGIAIVMVGAVALLVVKMKDKKQQKTLAQ